MARKPTKGKKAKASKNRISPLVTRQYGTEQADVVMNDLMYALRDSQARVPQPGGYYTFIYYAQKPTLLTDRYPIVAVTEVFDWGFNGINLHLDEPRRYRFDSTPSPYYMIKTTELDDALTLPLMKLVQNR